MEKAYDMVNKEVLLFQVECFTSSSHFFPIEPYKSALALLYPLLNASKTALRKAASLAPYSFLK